ncbi:hypothetical protein EX895_001302 [Sporisorium graminicola]|uniref:Uncharacterized protein n=1 Tax=Sporisorium graminicola TaxID=280036 RepID=A0A4U7KYN9_9BASI|nr:hypothetical protein EX895_001302 [Sporisorium graminicola]TKY90004.1 hypothetical protein EX895_001302 [Sporisorium graminicola]
MSSNIFGTLQHVTHRKLANLQVQRDRLTRLRAEAQAASASDPTPSNTLEALLAIFDKLGESETRLESPFHVNLSPKLIAELNQQATYDRTITASMIQGWCTLLNRVLDQRVRQINHAMLYGHLVTEWVHDHKQKQEAADMADTTSREALHQQRRDWEALAFRQDPVDAERLNAFLAKTFASALEPLRLGSLSALEQFRNKIEYHSQNFDRFDEDAVRKAISEVLSNDLYAGDKRANLRDLKAHKSVLREIADILNQDLENLESWQWADGGVQLSMRRHINGKYRVYMDEEVYQAIFLAHIGSTWSNSFHGAFGQFFEDTWKHGAGRKPTKEQQRFRTKKFHQVSESIEAERSASLNNLRREQYKDKFWLSAISPIARRSLARGYEGDGDGDDSYPLSFVDIKQQLLRMITAEQLIQCDLYGQFTVLQSDFRWFGPSLSHTTILTVLKFFGLPTKWLDFFAKFLSPSISFASDGSQAQRRRRTCGTPIAHQLSSLFGEVVMIALDFAVNQATDGGYLYRIHDDLWFWGQQDQCAVAWETLQKFSAETGLELNMDKTAACTLEGSQAPVLKDKAQEIPAPGKTDPILPWGPIRWGFLVLSADEGHWDIDQTQLEEHIDEMRVQLDATGSLMSWVRVWNSYMNSFFVNNFGKPAQCLGREHIRICMRAFETVQQRLLQADGGRHANLTDTVAAMIQERFGEEEQSVQASLIYFPAELGGLAVQNPLMELNTKLLVKKQDSPQEVVQKAWRGAHERLDRLIERWDNAMVRRRPRGDEFNADNEETFMTFQDFMANAEETEPELSKAYKTLLKDLKGNEEGILHYLIFDEQSVDGAQAYKQAATKSRTPFYWKRIVQLYGAETLDYYGSLVMSQAGALPMGVISYLPSEKIRWHN